MDDIEELPSWAAQVHVPGSNLPVEPQPTPPPRKRRTLRFLLLGLLGLVALAAVAGAGYWLATVTTGGDNTEASDTIDSSAGSDVADTDNAATADPDDGAAAADDEASGQTETGDTDDGAAMADDDEAEQDATDDADAEAAADDADAAADADAEEDAEDATETTQPAGEPVDNSDGSIRYAVLTGGQLFLRGQVPSEEYGAAIEEVALGVLGPGNVINEYEVDPTTPEAIGGPVYVEDVVLFEFNSVDIASPFLPILDLGTALMVQNPSVNITVVSRTDSVGSEEVNLEVSRQRAQAVVNYWGRQGIDTSRITIDARGEEEASGNEDEAALDRRVEFVINDLFG